MLLTARLLLGALIIFVSAIAWLAHRSTPELLGVTPLERPCFSRYLALNRNGPVTPSVPFVSSSYLADIIDNTRTITEADPNFGPVFLREKRAVLSEMVEVEGDRMANHPLYQKAAAQVIADAVSPARAG